MLTNFTPITSESIITELIRRLADRDEELDKHLCRIHKLEEDAEDDCSCIENQRVEITRLKALCQEPVDVDVVAVNLMRQFSVGKHEAREFAVAINAKLKEMT